MNSRFGTLRCSLVILVYICYSLLEQQIQLVLIEMFQFQALFFTPMSLNSHYCAKAKRTSRILKIIKYKKFDVVPQLTGGQKIYTDCQK